MKKILIRAGMLPFDNPDIGDIFKYDLFGKNMGNLIYQAAVVKTLMTEDDVEFTAINFRSPVISAAEIDEINSTYDCFVIPLANAFRNSFADELRRMTRLIKRLKIPCYVIGVGAQTSLKGNAADSRFDDQVRAFINEILERSATLGIRGEVSAEYLKRLGYKEDSHYTIIGCPSLFYYGGELPEAEVKELTPASSISMTRKNSTPEVFHKFMNRQMEIFPDHWFIPQTLEDFAVQYAGVPYTAACYPDEKGSPYYPSEYDSPVYREDRAPAFLNYRTWLDFLRERDFAFGSRIHGNIAALLAGTPCYIFPSDLRIKELADYHSIPYTPISEIREDTDLFKIHERADFGSIHRGHKERFDRYVSFLKKNGIPNIFDGTRQYDELPFDKKMNSIEFKGPEHSFCSLDEQGRYDRFTEYNIIQREIYLELRHNRNVIATELNRMIYADRSKVSLDDSLTSIAKKAARRKLNKRRNKK